MNEIRTASRQDGTTRLEVEMQSGDVIEVDAKHVVVEPSR